MLALFSNTIYFLFNDTGDSAPEGTKVCSPEKVKVKQKADEKDGLKEEQEEATVEVKKEEEEEDKDGAEVKPGKEKLNSTESGADSKPLGDKYSPKVSLKKIFSFTLQHIIPLIVFVSYAADKEADKIKKKYIYTVYKHIVFFRSCLRFSNM